jgi:hypothetical protein
MMPVVPAMIVPITPPVIVPIVITRSVVIGISVAVVIVRIIIRVVIRRWTYENPKVDTCFRRLWTESHETESHQSNYEVFIHKIVSFEQKFMPVRLDDRSRSILQ